MNRLGWNTVKLGEHALDGFAVDVGLIHLSQSVHAVMNTIVTVPTLTANTEIPIRMAQTRRSRSSCGANHVGDLAGKKPVRQSLGRSERKPGVIIPSGLSRR
jgi:hypothetical protein